MVSIRSDAMKLVVKKDGKTFGTIDLSGSPADLNGVISFEVLGLPFELPTKVEHLEAQLKDAQERVKTLTAFVAVLAPFVSYATHTAFCTRDLATNTCSCGVYNVIDDLNKYQEGLTRQQKLHIQEAIKKHA